MFLSKLFAEMTRLEYDEVFHLDSPGHILTCAAFTAGFIWIFLHAGDIRRSRVSKIIERISIFAVIGAQAIYYYWFFVLGAGGDPYPLHLCRIAGILICLTYFIPVKPLEDFAIMACVYGGISATFVSSPKPFAFPHITRWAFFTMHIGMVYAALFRVIRGHQVVGKKELVNAVVVNTICVACVLGLDILFDWNYMFLMQIRIPNLPISQAAEIREIFSTEPWITPLFMTIVYTFGAAASWVFVRWLSHKAMRMEYLGAVREGMDL